MSDVRREERRAGWGVPGLFACTEELCNVLLDGADAECCETCFA